MNILRKNLTRASSSIASTRVARYALALAPMLGACSMQSADLARSKDLPVELPEAMWQRVLDVPALRMIGEYCDDEIVEDEEYRDCRMARMKTVSVFTGTPCGGVIRTADHHTEVDILHVDGVQVPAPRPHVWRHEYDDVLFVDNVSGKSAVCRDYVPPPGTEVWVVGYPWLYDHETRVFFDHRPKVAIAGRVFDDRGFHPDLIHIELSGYASEGMSGGPVIAEVDGEMVVIATVVMGATATITPTSWLFGPPPEEKRLLTALLCRARDTETQ